MLRIIFILLIGVSFGAAAAVGPKKASAAIQFYRITGLDGGVLTAYAGPPPDGHTYPAAGNVTTERFDDTNPAQRWAIHDDFEDSKQIISEINDWNVVRVYFICPSCFPVDNSWIIEAAPGGTSLIYTTFILDDKISCMLNNGLDQRISFGPCDRTTGSSSHWKIVPILSN